jgi:lysophospholipase L1-like esterase
MRLTSRIPCLCVCLISVGLSGCGDDAVAASGSSTETGMSETGLDESGGMDTTGDGDGDGDPGDGDGDPGDEPEPDCLDAMFASGVAPGPGYDGLGLTIGSHCQGTNHQAIDGIERVVFIGDSVTVGSPPTPTDSLYRVLLADELAMLFDLVAASLIWENVNPLSGMTFVKEDGDFASCAEWGARTDDFLRGGMQLENCFAGDDYDKRTLVVTTMGGNDVASVAKDSIEGVTEDAVWAEVEMMLEHQRAMVHWFKDDPAKFPNGVFIVFGNVYEFTDATADLLSCPAASLAGFDANPEDPTLLTAIMEHINVEYAALAAESGTDVVFMFEGFCGHGFHADDPASPCYRGPGQEIWFDETCIHPFPVGHQALADMFLNVISE